MTCPECRAAGLASIVYEGPGTSTMVYYPPFFDELGRRHHHDANALTGSYRCSRGHRWHAPLPPPRCWCGWPDPPAADPPGLGTFTLVASMH